MTEPDRHYRRVIAIDGPAAAGKSTTANAVARRLGFVHLNSGLLYRAITWWAIENGWNEEDSDFEDRIDSVQIELRAAQGQLRVFVDGQEPGPALEEMGVADRVSAVAGVGAVRRAVLTRLREAGEQFDLVCDGRDIGTTVFPRADVKVFLVAEATERARRRLIEQGLEPEEGALEAEVIRLLERDRADASRAISPLRRATDAIEIDTTGLTFDEVVERIIDIVRERHLGNPARRE